MRTNWEWSKQRLNMIWKAQPGRSSLHIVPPGCDTHSAASEVATWITDRDRVTPIRENSRATIVKISVDATASSVHFVGKVRSLLAPNHKAVTEVAEERYPADWIENIVAAVHSDGGHPLLVISRFHDFAQIADEHLLSVLSTLRQLEHDGNLTTIAISPMNYRLIRENLSKKGHFPFVNSAYGDNHDEVVMPPLTRDEFLAAASKHGLSSQRSYQLFEYCGGPDCVHQALLSSALLHEEDIVERAVHSLGSRLEHFFEIVLGSESSNVADLRFRMATGQLLPSQVAFLHHQNLSAFLMKVGPRGTMIATSPVVARLLLKGKEGPWDAYSKVLEAVYAKQYGDAAQQIALLDQNSPHLKAFSKFLDILAALHNSRNGGLLEMDWRTAQRIGQHMVQSGLPIEPYKDWISQIIRWSGIILKSNKVGLGAGARLDVVAQQANNTDVQNLILYAISRYLGRIQQSGSLGEQVRAAGSIPESLLQAMAASLGVDPLKAPNNLPDLDYQSFFGGVEDYRRPAVGAALDLTQLLVIVPTILSDQCVKFKDEITICDPAFVKPLHQTLIARMRNATAHTYSEMDEKQATHFFKLCNILIADAKTVWGRNTPLKIFDEPDSHYLADLFVGRTGKEDNVKDVG